jgi:hypothetical protein
MALNTNTLIGRRVVRRGSVLGSRSFISRDLRDGRRVITGSRLVNRDGRLLVVRASRPVETDGDNA